MSKSTPNKDLIGKGLRTLLQNMDAEFKNPAGKVQPAAIEKAILNSDLGLNPSSSGTVIRVPMPPLSEERRKEMIRVVRAEAEQSRVAIRNIRRDANNHFKESVKSKSITEDDERRGVEAIQKLTDHFIAEADAVLAHKEKDLMEI
jgi:ribosome recycling factor